MTDLDPLAFACHAASLCHGMSAEDVVVLRLPPGAEFTFVVLATARSERQAYAVVDDVLGFCKRYRVDHRPLEGEAGWYLLDCHQVVVHALGQPQREFYQLERLWKKADRVEWEAELAKLPKLHAEPVAAPPPAEAPAADPSPVAEVAEAAPPEPVPAAPAKKPRAGAKGRRGKAPEADE